MAFGEIHTDNDVTGTVPYRAVAAALVRGRAGSRSVQERKGSAAGPGATCVPAGGAGSASGEEGAVMPPWSLPAAQPGGATPFGHLQPHAAVVCPRAPMPESALGGKAVNMALLCLLGFFFPPLFLSKHIAASGQLLFSRGDM